MTRLYVSGPVTGHMDFNREAFEEALDALCDAGNATSTPFFALGMDRAKTREARMLASIGELTRIGELPRMEPPGSILSWPPPPLRPYFGGVALLDGWERSEGARLEKRVAEACGIECRPWREWLGGGAE